MAEKNIRVWANWARSIEWLPDDDKKGAFLLKIVRYAFDGIEPEVEQYEGSAWEMIKTTIDADLQAQKNGSKGGNGRGNKTPAKTPQKTPSKTPDEESLKPPEKPPAKTPSKTLPLENMNQNMNQNHESEGESEHELTGASTCPEWNDDFAIFAKQVLDAWNTTTGQSVPYFTQAAWLGLRAAFDNGAKLDDVTRVINSKNDEWSGSKKTRAWLKPSTVLGEKLCEYLQEGVVNDGFDDYA